MRKTLKGSSGVKKKEFIKKRQSGSVRIPEKTVQNRKASPKTHMDIKPTLKQLENALRNSKKSEAKEHRSRLDSEKEQALQSGIVKALIANTDGPCFTVDRQYRYTSFNTQHTQVMKTLFGARIKIGHNILDYHTNPKDRAAAQKNFNQALKGKCFTIEAFAGEESRSRRKFEISHHPVIGDENQVVGVMVYARDVQDRWVAERELSRLNRTLRAVSNSNQALLKVENDLEYMEKICKIIVKDCEYSMVWIGLAEDNKNKTVRPVAYAGFEKGYLEPLNITWADTPRGRGPTGTAIRTGQVAFCRNMLTDPKFKPWREEAIKRGYASSIAIPMLVNQKAIGAIMIYSKEPDPFSPEEVSLLQELTADFTFGVTSLRLKAEKARAEEELRLSEEQYHSLFQTMTQGVVYQDGAGKIISANPAAEKILGLTFDQMRGATSMDPRWKAIHPDGTDFPGETHPIVVARKTGKPISNVIIGTFNPTTSKYNWSNVSAIPQFRPGEKKPYQVYAVFDEITKRKQIEDTLAASETRYRRLFEAARDGILILDANTGQITDVNPFLIQLLGYPEKEFIGKELWEIGLFKDIAASRDAFEELQAKEYLRYEDLPLETNDGRRIEVEFVSNVYTVDHRKVVQCNIRDVSARKKAEAVQSWLASFPEYNPQPVMEVDSDGKVIYQNPASKRFFPDLVWKGKNHPWLKHLDQYFAEGRAGKSSFTPRENEIGSLHYLQNINYVPETKRLRIYGMDISKRVHAEEARKRLASILEATPDMVATFTPEGEIQYMNKAARAMLGIPLEGGISSESILRSLPEWSKQMLAELGIPQAIRDGAWEGETVIVDKDGKEIPISMVVVAHREANGEIAYLSTVARDLSLRKQVEDALIQSGTELEQRVEERTQELNESNERLREEVEERQRLADSLHDAINQSLFSAGLIAEVLPKLWERDPEEAKKSLQDLRRLTRGAQAEMRTLLTELRPSIIAVNSLDYLLELLSSAFSGRMNIPVNLKVEGDVNLPNEVKTVYYRVCQEALNNIAKHAHAYHVDIFYHNKNGWVNLSIHDDGCGFTPDSTSVSHYGLGMIKERMETIGGEFIVKSQPGDGCTITIRWQNFTEREKP